MIEYMGDQKVHNQRGAGLRGLGDVYVHFELVLPNLVKMDEQERGATLANLVATLTPLGRTPGGSRPPLPTS
jgi:hypothetical protein